MKRFSQLTGMRSALMVGLLTVASLVGSLPAATWTESFEGRFSKDFFVEPQDMGGGWSNVRINPARGYSGNAGDVSLVKSPARKGTGAMMCVRGEKGRRMEFELVNCDENDSPRLNQHCWSAISILVPEVSMTHSGMVIQWHGGVPNAAQGKEYAQGPEACLRLDNGQFIYRTNYKHSKQSDPGNRTLISHTSRTGTFALGNATTDTAGRAAAAYGTFALTHSAASIGLTWTPHTPLQAWRYQYLGTIENTGPAADTFDANSDGETNLLEFATAQNPSTILRRYMHLKVTAP